MWQPVVDSPKLGLLKQIAGAHRGKKISTRDPTYLSSLCRGLNSRNPSPTTFDCQIFVSIRVLWRCIGENGPPAIPGGAARVDRTPKEQTTPLQGPHSVQTYPNDTLIISDSRGKGVMRFFRGRDHTSGVAAGGASCKLLYAQSALTLQFKSRFIEGQYLRDAAASRLPILIIICCFDVAIYLIRLATRIAGARTTLSAALRALALQLGNLAVLYGLMGFVNWRSRKRGHAASFQEELLLSLLVASSICILVVNSAGERTAYAAFFLVCATSVLKIRWTVGTAALALPMALVTAVGLGLHAALPLPAYLLAAAPTVSVDVVVNFLTAWAVGGLMGFISDSERRRCFIHHRAALAAAEKELGEARARVQAERDLAAAQAQAQARALVVARERAASEAKSEFMGLMMHEVRTPLNGCLASAEMLLETDLDVSFCACLFFLTHFFD
jgi:hypothetical protein